jgi:acetylornithine deacetylase/succinyl-diaminopimelate desuccinylase-like protein
MSTNQLSAAEREELHAEAISICQTLIRIPSVNFGDGKGDESAVAAKVVELLGEVGIDSKIYESAPGRCNVIAHIKAIKTARD